jgi:hypothetical protein
MNHELHGKGSETYRRQENEFPERPTSASIALYMQSNLNCGLK